MRHYKQRGLCTGYNFLYKKNSLDWDLLRFMTNKLMVIKPQYGSQQESHVVSYVHTLVQRITSSMVTHVLTKPLPAISTKMIFISIPRFCPHFYFLALSNKHTCPNTKVRFTVASSAKIDGLTWRFEFYAPVVQRFSNYRSWICVYFGTVIGNDIFFSIVHR